MSHVLRVATYPGSFHLAVTQNDSLCDFQLWWPYNAQDVGSVYGGVVTSIVKAMGGAFVDLGEGKDGFLPLRPQDPKIQEGKRICVEVDKAPQAGKGRRLKLRTDLKAEHKGLIRPAPTILERIECVWGKLPIIVDSPHAKAVITSRTYRPCLKGFSPFPGEIEEACENLLSPHIALTPFVDAIITPTPALVAIDMDMKPLLGAKGDKQRTQFQMNEQALPLLMEQIRLRNLSGAIMVDLAGLSVKNRFKLLDVVREALKSDPLKPRCVGLSRLGFIEIVRKRVFPSLQQMCESPYGSGLTILRKIVKSYPQIKILRGSKDIIGNLRAMPRALGEAYAQCGREFSLEIMSGWESHKWEAIL